MKNWEGARTRSANVSFVLSMNIVITWEVMHCQNSGSIDNDGFSILNKDIYVNLAIQFTFWKRQQTSRLISGGLQVDVFIRILWETIPQWLKLISVLPICCHLGKYFQDILILYPFIMFDIFLSQMIPVYTFINLFTCLSITQPSSTKCEDAMNSQIWPLGTSSRGKQRGWKMRSDNCSLQSLFCMNGGNALGKRTRLCIWTGWVHFEHS